MAVRDALLVAGDQIVFDAQHRFVLEVPWAPSATVDEPALMGETGALPASSEAATPSSSSVLRWPWLLLAALLMAGALSALLLFGAG
ncbi:hypothetical protein D9M70_639500 [compost metagenome]